jgi:hypothetical protein
MPKPAKKTGRPTRPYMTEDEEQSIAAEVLWSLVDRNGPFPPERDKDQDPMLGMDWRHKQRGAWTVSLQP